MEAKWNGVYPAITTKFNPEGDFDFATFDMNIEKQIDAGINGLILGGSLGEASTLSETEKYELLEHTLLCVNNRIPI